MATKKKAKAPVALTRRDALKIMEDCGGHAFLTVEAGDKISVAFGRAPRPQTVRANTGEFKGLEVRGAKANEPIDGYACVYLAESIADSFEGDTLPRVYRMQEGRGSRCRSACETIDAALTLAGE